MREAHSGGIYVIYIQNTHQTRVNYRPCTANGICLDKQKDFKQEIEEFR